MEIILKQNIANLGHKDDIINVKNGHGRNYLIPQGYAILATGSAKKVLAENIRQRAHKEEKIKAEATELAAKLEVLEITIGAKTSKTGKIFGSVNNIQIADAIKKQLNYDIDRKKIAVDSDNIKEVGTYTAKINIYKDINADMNFEVFAE